MASLKELKEQRVYNFIQKNRYYTHENGSYRNPLICTNCNHDFMNGDMDIKRFKEVTNFKFCPYCGEKFDKFINRNDEETCIDKTKKKEFKEFIIISNMTNEETKALIEISISKRKSHIMTGSMEEIEQYLNKYGIKDEAYEISDEYSIDIDDELFEYVDFEDEDC